MGLRVESGNVEDLAARGLRPGGRHQIPEAYRALNPKPYTLNHKLGMFPLILAVLSWDSSTPSYNPHQGLLVQRGNVPTLNPLTFKP